MRTSVCAFILTIASSYSLAITKEERKDILDSIRSTVEEKAGQPVRFKVEHLNLAKDWAVLVGSLLGAEGKKMDWSKAQDCDEDLDKMLWVVAQKQNNAWHVKDVDICSPEPPYWYLKPKVDYKRPCEIYEGLNIADSRTAEDECRAHQRKHPAKK